MIYIIIKIYSTLIFQELWKCDEHIRISLFIKIRISKFILVFKLIKLEKNNLEQKYDLYSFKTNNQQKNKNLQIFEMKIESLRIIS